LTVLCRSDGLFGIGLPLLEASTNNKRQYFAAVTYGFKWLISSDSHVQVGSTSAQQVTHKPRNSHDLGCASGRFFRTFLKEGDDPPGFPMAQGRKNRKTVFPGN